MSWYSTRWRRSNSSTATPLPTVAPTSPLSPTTGGATAVATNGVTNPGGPQAGFAHLLPQTNASDPTGATRADRKALEPLFGPNIGAVSSGPAWTGYVDRDKKVLGGLSSTDELTPEVINSWVEKSKDPTQPTTTLQALVNLKRPSLRLVPLSAPSYASDGPQAPPQQHALEFTYDADAPKVSIRVHVYLPKGHPDLGGTFSSPTAALSSPSGATAATGTSAFVSPATVTSPSTTSSSHPYAKLLVFETVTEGGFGRKLKIVDGAVVELGRFEKVPAHLKRLSEGEAGQRQDQQERSQVQRDASAGSEIPNIDSLRNMTLNTPAEGGAAAANSRRSRRFTRAFRFITPHRHRDQEHELRAAGPALAVVDVNAQPEDGATPAAPNSANATSATQAKKEDDHGVKLTIRLVALDEQGAEMGCPNEQVTYLHVVRVGTKPAAAPKTPATAGASNAEAEGAAATAASSTGGADAQPTAVAENEGEDEEEDNRPWVVKVVKREATIGPHTFHLHEIFGLTNSASDSASDHAPAPVPAQGHTYPPTGGVVGNDTPDDPSPSEECLLCLSSPREVVLLPCRHLVACKDCALNMVEFGAGGAINQGSETQAAATTTAGGAAGTTAAVDGQDAAGGEAAGMTTNIVNAMNTRRKRKAKGWFCPVCRQPYTSLLRLTTAPPPPAATPATTAPPATAPAVAATPVDGAAPVAANGDEANGGQSNGLLGSLRPGFFRNLTSGKGLAENAPSAGATSSATAAGGSSTTAAAPGSTTARASGAAEGEGEEMVQVNARAGDVESTAGLGRVGA